MVKNLQETFKTFFLDKRFVPLHIDDNIGRKVLHCLSNTIAPATVRNLA